MLEICSHMSEDQFSREAPLIVFFYTLQHLHGKGNFLTFSGCPMEGFVAIEECPLVTREFDQDGGTMATEYDEQVEVTIPKSIHTGKRRVKMKVGLTVIGTLDTPRQ